MRLAKFTLAGAFFLIHLSVWAQSSIASCDQAQIISEAQRTTTKNGVVISNEVVKLPDALPITARRADVKINYQIDVSPCAGSDHAAIYSYRLGAPYRVFANAELLDSWLPQQGFRDDWIRSTFTNYAYNGRAPTVFALPKGTAKIQIALTSTPLLAVGLTTVTIGPQKAIATLHAFEYQKTAYASDFVAWVSLLIGLAALALFLKRSTASGLHWFAAGCLFWAMRNLVFLNNIFPNAGFGAEILISYGIILSSFSLAIAVLIFNQMWSIRSTHLALYGFALVTLLHATTFVLPDLAIPLRTVFNLLVASTFIWIAIRLLKQSKYFLAVCLFVTVGCGVHDALMGFGILTPTNFPLAFWGFSLLISAMAILSSLRGVNALNRAQNANIELEERVAQKNAELKTYYDAEQAERIKSERARLNREIHDGIGAQLMTALRGVERGALSQDQITESLQDGLDELRLLMDSADIGSDLHGALFAWRNRWEPRLNAVDLLLDWHIDEAVANVKLNQQTTLQLIRILQEAVANVVKHAKASKIDVRMQSNNGNLTLTIADDGVGISKENIGASNRGLKHIEQRAMQIGASYSIQKMEVPASGTIIKLELEIT